MAFSACLYRTRIVAECRTDADAATCLTSMIAWQPEWTHDRVKMLVTFLLGIASGSLLTWFAERRTRAVRVLERYLGGAEQQHERQISAAFRVGLLQRAGAAELSRRRLRKFAARVVAHGLADPLVGYDFFSDWRREPYLLLRWANREGIDLSDEKAILLRLAGEADGIVAQPKK